MATAPHETPTALPQELEVNLRAAVQKIQTAAQVVTAFSAGPAMLAMIEERVTKCVRQAESPFVDRAAAAERWFKSLSDIDRAAEAGILTRLTAGGRPLFLKEEGDNAIRDGRWTVDAVKHGLKQRKVAA